MRKALFIAVLLFSTSALVGSPVITSVNPNNGPVEGGTTVTIRGTGFSNNCILCSPPFADPEVFFGMQRAQSVRFIDSTTLEAVTPAHPPETVSVTVSQFDGSDPNHHTLPNAFTYVGDIYDAFDPVLFPIFLPPIQGAFGSEFRTTAHVWNQGFGNLELYGIDTNCTTIDPPLFPTNPFPLQPHQPRAHELFTGCSQSVGRLFFVPKGKDAELAASLRVSETSRRAEDHGVSVPVVRRKDFREDRIALLDVPIDPRFRLTLRIYGLNRGTDFLNVTVNGELHQIPLHPSSDLFTPSIIVFTDFPTLGELPAGQSTIIVTVDTPRGPGGVGIPGSPIWAFIAVTNNETQHITTIVP